MTDKLNIEKNIPTPSGVDTKRERSVISETITQMVKGDSVFVPQCDDSESLRATARVFAKRNDVDLITRKCEGGFRIWHLGKKESPTN